MFSMNQSPGKCTGDTTANKRMGPAFRSFCIYSDMLHIYSAMLHKMTAMSVQCHTEWIIICYRKKKQHMRKHFYLGYKRENAVKRKAYNTKF